MFICERIYAIMTVKKIEFEFYTRPNGKNEFLEFLRGLPIKDQAKFQRLISKVEEQGLLVAIQMQWVRKIQGDIFELRSIQGNDIQRGLYFHGGDSRYIVTHGFSKKTQKTPLRELDHAARIRNEYLEEMKKNADSKS